MNDQPSKHTAEIYQDHQGQWRWRVRTANYEIVAQGEAYTRRSDAVRGLEDAHIDYDELDG